MFIKHEMDMVRDIVKNDLHKRFFNIVSIDTEYRINNKRVDIRVVNNSCHNLIECKLDLNTYDIGQLLTYGALYNLQTGINSKLFLYVYKINHNLDSMLHIFKVYNLDITLVHYSQNKIYNLHSKCNDFLSNDYEHNLETKYLEYAKHNLVANNQLLGYRDISIGIGLSEYEGKQIHKKLVHKGILFTVNKKTYLKK